MGHAALTYAEQNLGVHRAHEQAIEARDRLDTILDELSKARDRKRVLEYARDDREQEVLADEWLKHPDMAVTKMPSHFKTALHKDAGWREIRTTLAAVLSEVDGLECDQKIAEADIRIAASRLVELGGYLQYLAAVKTAESTSRTGDQQ